MSGNSALISACQTTATAWAWSLPGVVSLIEAPPFHLRQDCSRPHNMQETGMLYETKDSLLAQRSESQGVSVHSCIEQQLSSPWIFRTSSWRPLCNEMHDDAGGISQSKLQGQEAGARVQEACCYRRRRALLLCSGRYGHLARPPLCAQPVAPKCLLCCCQHKCLDAETGREHLETSTSQLIAFIYCCTQHYCGVARAVCVRLKALTYD